MAAPNDIILGAGVFSIGGTAIALTRGGGKFSVEREYRVIEADGDFGPVKGRIVKTKSVPLLSLKALELLPANVVKMYPAVGKTTSGTGATTLDTITGTTEIADADYNSTVTWVGKTKGGRTVTIEIQNAICLENIDWELADKEEVVPEVNFTGTYLENARTTEPWSIKYLGTP